MTGDAGRTDEPVRYWDALTSPEVAELVEEDTVVILPLAAIEQHGPHLPLSTDLDIAMGIVRRAFGSLSADDSVFLLPPLAVGASREHEGYPGTLSVKADLMSRLIRSRGSDVARCGVRRLVLLNAHGGNRAAMESAGLELRRDRGMLVVKADYFRFPRPDGTGLPESEWRWGIHGGAVETAMMLHLCPERVRLDRVGRFESLEEELENRLRRLSATGPMAFSWVAGDLNPAGAVGDPRGASAELGERLLAHYGGVLSDLIRDALDFPLEALS